MDKQKISEIVSSQRTFFETGRTKDVAFRVEQLKALRKVIVENEKYIFDALKQDLDKPAFEAYGGDVAIVLNQIDYTLRHLRSWIKPQRVKTPLALFPASSRLYAEPYGVALIIGPWNFPVQLLLAPLVGAVAAGNCAVLKPSPLASHTSNLLEVLVGENFDPRYVTVVEGGAETAQALLEETFDYIFFTGGTATGRLIMAAAAKRLTPVTLELGGKNPCIVHSDAPLGYAARRIIWGKFFNAGQSCVAVDYLLVHKSIKRELLERMKQYIDAFYGRDPSESPDYARIINDAHFDRLSRLLDRGRILVGGKTDRQTRYIAPTIILDVAAGDAIMQDEIFGPLLPVIEYDDLSEAVSFVNARPKPLALYFFSRDAECRESVLRQTSSGGGCINDTVVHETATCLPFGGVGMSGIGKYHGKASFDTFSHKKSFLKGSSLIDFTLRYPPYNGKLKLFRKIF